MLTPTKVKSETPRRGLKKTQATAVTKQAIVPPQTKEKMAAAMVAAKPKSEPTRGIHFNNVITGMKRRNQPKMWRKIARGLTHFSSILIFSSSTAKNSSKVWWPSLQPSTTSSKAKFIIMLTSLQTQQKIQLSMQGTSAAASVESPALAFSNLGFHLRKVMQSSYLNCWAMIVASAQG